MRKIDSAPTRDVLVNLLHNDALGRNGDLAEFAGILKSIEGGFSLFVDADWGSGKTFFVRQVAYILEEVNPFLESHGDLDGLLGNNCELAPYTELNSFLPVYYNAWENDHWDDPLPSIAASIALQGDACASFRSDTEAGEKIAKTLDAILGVFGHGGASSLRDAFSGRDLIQAYRDRETLRSSVSKLVDVALPEKANTLLLIVDELDRCRLLLQ